MNAVDAPWRIKTRPCPFYQQGRCVFEQSCNFVHDITVPTPTPSSSSALPELLDALRDVLDPPDSISLVSEHGASPHISGEGWTLVNDSSIHKDPLLSPVSLPDLNRFSTLKPSNDSSFDSGYGSEWASPQLLPSTLNLLASPFGSPSSRMSASRLFARSPFSPTFAPHKSDRGESPELDSPSTSRLSATTITPEQEEDDDDDQYSTAQWSVSSPPEDPHLSSRFSTSTVALTEDSDSDSDSSDDDQTNADSTAHLAYLSSSPTTTQTFPPPENDTINNLYEVYLHSPPQPNLPSDEEDRGRLRGRVFTPASPEPKFTPRESSTPRSASRRSSSRHNFPSSAFSTSPESSPRSVSSRGPVFQAEPQPSPEQIHSHSRPVSSISNGGKVPFGFRSEVCDTRVFACLFLN
ncbi:hypothetical protein FB45DRAFT_522005 [Roridomyces roridus]|uniref:C3H1-type domain-containing protein n=1 Tax=Roridomyces roridus TaxID=1738132 RepID=A0AAD7BXG4_9AGAR|nr:hypothetical protein FB45DRAFT_522005 [Roridomyces roridus]